MSFLEYSKRNSIQNKFGCLRGRVISVAGLPGYGKSKFCEDAAYYLNISGIPSKHFEEYVNNELLNLYLETPDSIKRYAFPFQTIMVQRRIGIYREALAYAKTGGVALVDGPINTDLAFELMNYCNGNISEREHAVYLNILSEFKDLQEPDYLIYFNVTTETAMRRIAKRGRKNEVRNYDPKFYKLLGAANNLSFQGLEVNCISYDEDAEMDGDRISFASIFRVLSQIITRETATTGLPSSINIPQVTSIEQLKSLMERDKNADSDNMDVRGSERSHERGSERPKFSEGKIICSNNVVFLAINPLEFDKLEVNSPSLDT